MRGKHRHELKFGINYADYLALKPRIKTLMKSDPHVNENGVYQIHSIYFDNYRDKALLEKVGGVQKREKYRVRWYNDSKEVLMLEKKMKVNGLCMKFGTAISEEQLERLINHDAGWLMESDDELLREFYYRIQGQRLKPCVQVSYLREPYIYEYGNVRVTFDSRIKTSLSGHGIRQDSPFIPTSEGIIMEVKFDEYIPAVIAEILQIGNIRQEAFSKYTLCRKYG